MSARKTEISESNIQPYSSAAQKAGKSRAESRNAASEPHGANAVGKEEDNTAPRKAASKRRTGKTADNAAKVASNLADTADDTDVSAKSAKPHKKAHSSAKAEPKASEISSKTPQVLKLIEQNNGVVNPTIMAGKSSIPRKLRGIEPLSRIIKRETEEIFGLEAEETYNVTALVIADHAEEILGRFNACCCEVCVEQLSRLTAEAVPSRFAKLRKRDVENNHPDVEALKEPLRKTVTSSMIRIVMQNRKRSFHE